MFHSNPRPQGKAKLLAVICFISFLVQASILPAAQEDELKSSELIEQDNNYQGWLDMRFRMRSEASSSTRDVDLIVGSYFELNSNENAGKFVLDGVLYADLDNETGGDEAFYSLSDTWNDSMHGFVYNAWLGIDDFKLGRQEIHRADALFFDGLKYDHKLTSEAKLTVFGGTPVHFYDESSSGDRMAGLGLDWRVSPKLRVAVDEVWLRDSAVRFSGADGTANDLLSVVSATWLANQNGMVRGSASMVGDRARRQDISGQWYMPNKDLWARFRLRHQNDYGEFIATEIAPFSAVIGDVAPYWDSSVELTKRMSEQIDIGFGYQGRMLENDSDVGINNREFNRWYISVDHDELPFTNSSGGLRADIWDSSDGSIIAGGAWLKWDFNAKHEFSVGTDFSKYRFDVFTGREYLDDRQYWIKAKLPLGDQRRMRLRYSRDRSQFGTDHLFEAAWALEF